MPAAAVSCKTIRPVLPFVFPANAEREETVGGPARALTPPHRPAAAPTRLLLIDDDPAGLAEQLRRAFPGSGYRVQVVGSGPGALQYLGADSADVVILALGRAESSGLETYQQIRRLDARVPVIFVAGVKRADAAIEAMKQGSYGDFSVQARRGRPCCGGSSAKPWMSPGSCRNSVVAWSRPKRTPTWGHSSAPAPVMEEGIQGHRAASRPRTCRC